MTKEDVRSMKFADLLLRDIEEPQRAPYRDEIKRRLKQDSNLKSYLAAYPAPEEISSWDAETKVDSREPPSPQSQGPVAQEMLNSSWDFSWADMKLTPEQAREFVAEIAKTNYTGLAMSERQWSFWLVIRSRYRRWLREQS